MWRMPFIPAAYCKGCNRRIEWWETGMWAYEGYSWHRHCLERALQARRDRLLRKTKRTGQDYEELAEVEEAICALRSEG